MKQEKLTKPINEHIEGYMIETKDVIFVPALFVKEEGKGHLSRFIKEIESKGKTIKFTSVVSEKLAMILLKKGYEPKEEWFEEAGENVLVMEKVTP